MSYYLEDADNTGYLDQGLEIGKLIEREKKAAAGSEFDVLHDEVKTQNKTEALEEVASEETQGVSTDSTEGDGTSEEDSETPPEGDEETTNPFDSEEEGGGGIGEEKNVPEDDAAPPDEKQDEKNDQKGKVIAESLRNPYDMHYSSLVLEEITREDVYDGVSKVAGFVYRAGVAVAGLLFEFGKILVALGVRYGPGIADKLRRGVIYLFTRSVKVLFRTIASSSDYIKRHYHSVSSLKKDIASLKKASEELNEMQLGEMEDENFTEEKSIPWFVYGTKAGFLGSAGEVLHFLDATIDPMAKRVLEDIHAVQKLIDMSSVTGIRGNVLAMMDVNPIGSEYSRKTLKNYPMDNSDVETYVYQRPLPNGVIFVTNLPKNNLGDIEKVSKAYKDSSIFLGVETSPITMPEALPYLKKEELDKYIDQLAVIADLLQEHTGHYVRIANEGSKLKLGYRHYYQKLSSSPEKVSLHESLAEFVFLKQSFASKTYLAGMIDIHDYVSAYLVRATRFAKKNLKALSATATKPSDEPSE